MGARHGAPIPSVSSQLDVEAGIMNKRDLHGAIQGLALVALLLGARTVDQLTESLAAADLELGPEELELLTRVSAPGLPPYPYGLLEEHAEVSHWRDLGTDG